jgi:rhodanese-related sulfurtransferase
MSAVIKTSRGLITTTTMKFPKYFMRRLSIQRMSVTEYSKILKSKERENYQIVDVREPNELIALNLEDKNIMNLPMSQSLKWGADIARQKHSLDPLKPVICVVSNVL